MPVGIALGMITSSQTESQFLDTVRACLSCVASGCVVYSSFVNVLANDMQMDVLNGFKTKLALIFSFFLGFISIIAAGRIGHVTFSN